MRPPSRTSRALVLGALVALSLVACGDDDTASTSETTEGEETTTTTEVEETTTTEAEPITFEEAEAQYNDCLVDNGSSADAIPLNVSLDELVELEPDSNAVIERGYDPAFIAAHAECWPPFKEAMDAGATPPTVETTSTTVDAEKAAMMREAVECLNQRGWDFLEPGGETGALTMEPRDQGFDWDDEAFLDDQWECQQLAGMIPAGTSRPRG